MGRVLQLSEKKLVIPNKRKTDPRKEGDHTMLPPSMHPLQHIMLPPSLNSTQSCLLGRCSEQAGRNSTQDSTQIDQKATQSPFFGHVSLRYPPSCLLPLMRMIHNSLLFSLVVLSHIPADQDRMVFSHSQSLSASYQQHVVLADL